MARPKSSQFIHYQQCQMDSLALGQLFLPALQKMSARIPNLQCAVLCTPDGFNICSLGLNENQVGKMAALSSSLFSVGDATAVSVASEGTASGGLDLITLEAGGLQIVSTKIPRYNSHMVLLAGARAPLGVVLMGVKATAADVQKIL